MFIILTARSLSSAINQHKFSTRYVLDIDAIPKGTSDRQEPSAGYLLHILINRSKVTRVNTDVLLLQI